MKYPIWFKAKKYGWGWPAFSLAWDTARLNVLNVL